MQSIIHLMLLTLHCIFIYNGAYCFASYRNYVVFSNLCSGGLLLEDFGHSQPSDE